MKYLPILFLSIAIFLSTVACKQPVQNEAALKQKESKADKDRFMATMVKHLSAVSNRDATTLASTLSPSGKMQLILPGSEIIYSAKGFMKFHNDWFVDTTWTFETKILNTEIGTDFGIAVSEVIYREPERNGLPYFNRQIVTYALQKEKGQWYIIKDHCSSIEKSTDNKTMLNKELSE